MVLLSVDPNKVATYPRWSTDDQGEGHTLETQVTACKRVFQENGWTWDESRVYVDDGYSGTTLDRPAMNRLRSDIASGRITCVVVYRLDRLSRNQRDSVTLQEEWEDVCHVVAINEGINTIRNPEATKYWGFWAWYGQIDRDRLVGNMKAGKYSAARKGSNPGARAPYGYRSVGERGNKRFVVVDEEAAIVRRIFSEYLSGKGSLTIAAELIADDVPTPMQGTFKGATWSQRTVGRILDNEAYFGRFTYGKEVVNPKYRRNPKSAQNPNGVNRLRKNDEAPVVVENVFPVIVSREDFETARQIRLQRADRSNRNRSARSQYLLTGIIRCAKCGAPVAGSRSMAKGTYINEVYLCTGRKAHRTDCDAKSVKKADLEELVMSRVRAKFTVENRERIVAAIAAQLNEREREAKVVVDGLRRELDDVQAKKRRWIVAFENGVDVETFNARIAELRTEEASITARIAEAEQRLADVRNASPEVNTTAILEAAKRFDEWDELSAEQRKQALRRLVKEIRVYVDHNGGRHLRIHYWTDNVADVTQE